MSKRLATQEPTGLKSPPPRKRSKHVENHDGGNLSGLGSTGDESSDTPGREGLDVSEDPDYYFEDGNVIVRIDDVLFRIHASLFKTKSEIFKKMFTMPVEKGNGGGVTAEHTADRLPTEDQPLINRAIKKKASEGEAPKVEDDAKPRNDQETESQTAVCGTSNAHPIVISDISPSQFRHLMKMFYSLAHESPLTNLSETSKNAEELWGRYELLLDVARLSHRFRIPDMEEWAACKLGSLVNAKTKELAYHFCRTGGDYNYIVEALQYAKDVSNSRLVHDSRYMIQLSFPALQSDATLGNILSLFRFEDLRDLDKAIYGYMFLLMLGQGHQAWGDDRFSHMDRMALFSAQCRLTPLPDALFEGLKSPLCVAANWLAAFSNQTSSEPTPHCTSKCLKAAVQAWKEEFDEGYYGDLTGHRFLLSITALRSLPRRRLKFGRKIRGQTCPRSCYNEILSWIDHDIELLYTRLADYYKAIP